MIAEDKWYMNRELLMGAFEQCGTGTAVAELYKENPHTIYYWLRKFGATEDPKERLPSVYWDRGYETVKTEFRGTNFKLLLHRLQAVAEYGFDAVVDKEVHHINHHRFDNRPCNLQPMDVSDHSSLHATRRWQHVTEELKASGEYAVFA